MLPIMKGDKTMKYIAEYNINDQDYEVEFDFSGSTNKWLFTKAGRKVFSDIVANGAVKNVDMAKLEMDLPNIWTNGAVGGLWLTVNDEVIDISLRQKRCNSYIAC